MGKRILIAIDNSRTSIEAVHYAARLAQAIPPVAFTLFHIQAALSTYLTDEAHHKPSARSALEKVAAENRKRSTELLETASQRMISRGVDASAIQLMSLPRSKGVADDILAYATATMVDAILVGRRGASNLRQWLVGSVTANLVEHSQVVPIWVVDGTVGSSDILLAADGSRSSIRALDHLAFMLSGQPAPAIKLLHIRPVLQDYCEIKLDGKDTEAAQSVLWDDDRHCMDDFHSQAVTVLQKNGLDVDDMELTTLDGKISVPKAILRYARDKGFGAVVMGRRGRGKSSFFGSISRGVFQRAENIALWVVP